jgi:hypothetical protein
MLSGQELNTVNVISDNESNLVIPSRLVAMERYPETTDEYNIIFMTLHIANIVASVQEETIWAQSYNTLNIYFRSPETRVAAGKRFQKMFFDKFKRQDPDAMPPCYKLDRNSGMHPFSPLARNAETAMPWNGLGQQPALEYISIGKDAKGNLYSTQELRAVIEAAMDKESPPIRFIIPCAENWASWDAAVIVYSREERAIHVVFLQLTTDPEHEIYAKGLNQVRDVFPTRWKRDKGLNVYYHYVLVLLIQDEESAQIPKWKHVLVNSKDRKKDTAWHPNNLWQYVMFVPMKELFKPPSEGSTDMTENSLRADDLEPELLLPVDGAESRSESRSADTRKDSTRPATRNKAPAKKRKAPTKEKPTNGKEETEQATYEGRSKRARRDIDYTE